MKTLKATLPIVLMFCLIFSVENSTAQIGPLTYTTTQDQCVNLLLNGMGISNLTVVTPPVNGDLIAGAIGWIYCPDSSFIGNDDAVAWVCTAGFCDTINVFFVVGPNCNLSITTAQDSTPCLGPLPSIGSFVSGGTPPYAYLWDDGSTTSFICNLVPGSYCVTATDVNGCSGVSCLTVGCQITSTIVQDSSGCLISSTAGGNTPYFYQWFDQNGVALGTNPDFCPNQNGTYCIAVTDVNNCSSTACFTVGSGCQMTATINQAPASGCLAASPAGGTGSYTYQWTTGDINPTICPTTAGNYCVTITDAANCDAFACFSFTPGCQLSSTVVDSSGCLVALPFGANGGVAYLWSTGEITQIVCPPAGSGGVYCVTITDNLGCTSQSCFTIGGCQMTASVSQTGLGCLTATVIGGTAPYTYSWNNGVAGNMLCNVPAGTYCVVITDAAGCSATACTTLTTGCQLTTTIVDSAGCLVALATGGSGSYTYIWSNGDVSDVLCPPAGSAGTFCVTVTDGANCVSNTCFTIGGCQLTINFTQIPDTTAACLSIIAVPSGGSAPYSYIWTTGETTASHCELFIPIPQLCVSITDANGCAATACFNATGCQLSTTVTTNPLTGCLTATPSGGSPPYTYDWSNSATNQTICPNVPGVYCVTVVDGANCSASACETIGQNNCAFQAVQNSAIPPYSVSFYPPNTIGSQVISAFWDFGDGITDSTISPTHIYDSCGVSYLVVMTAIYNTGIACTYTDLVFVACDSIIGPQVCQAYFLVSQDSASYMTFHFTDQSVYNPVSYQWDFGDGTTSTLQDPSHTYANVGFYNVCLVITTANGCSSVFCQQVKASPPVQDLRAYLFHFTTATPGFPMWVNLNYYNQGTITMDGTVQYRYPAGTSFDSALPPPASHDATQRLLTFNFNGLLPASSRTIAVDLTASSSLGLGTVVYDTMWVYPISGDLTPTNNVSTAWELVVGSWDPNDKAVSPKGIGEEGEIPVETEELAYTIRFQNTGTAVAHNVAIKDVFDNNIDLSTVKVTEATHDNIVNIVGSELEVSFDNIMLPDSGSSQRNSQGYISVVAKLKPGLNPGTQIFNTAEIYFDFNNPVITNTVVNTLTEKTTGIGVLPDFTFSIVPNPSEGQVILSGRFSRDMMYEITNELGQIMQSADLKTNTAKVDITQLDAGIYFIRVKNQDRVATKQLVVVR